MTPLPKHILAQILLDLQLVANARPIGLTRSLSLFLNLTAGTSVSICTCVPVKLTLVPAAGALHVLTSCSLNSRTSTFTASSENDVFVVISSSVVCLYPRSTLGMSILGGGGSRGC
jgi:hypothetical protein